MREWLKECREQRGISTKEMAARCFLSENYYNAIEAGKEQRQLNPIIVGQISAILSVDPVEIWRKETFKS